MDHINRTFASAWVQTHQFIGLPLTFPPFTTLNEELEIQKTSLPSPSDDVSLNFYVWGTKGHDFTRGADGRPKNLIVPHRATDGNLYGLMPFSLRELNNDLSAAERERYVLRKQVEIAGKMYWAYYGRRLDKSSIEVIAQYVTVNPVTGVETPTAYVPNANNLKPVPPVLSQEGVWQTSGDYVTVRAPVPLGITESQITEMRNAATIILGSDEYATFSEIGMCTGANRVINAQGPNGSTFNFNEAIGVQIATFANVLYDLRFANKDLSVVVNMGVTEPQFRITAADTTSAIG